MLKMVLAALITLLTSTGAADAQAATWNLSWINNAGSDPAAVTVLERGPVVSARCPTAVGPTGYVEIATVPITQVTYVDTAAPAGFLCYRAKVRVAIDPNDGSPVLQSESPYSNVDATKPGRVQGLRVQAP